MGHKTVYPEWVRAFREKGTTIRKVGDSYYLYRRSTQKTETGEGRKYVDTYIGRITPDGVIKSGKKKMTISGIQVREYGFSEALRQACPDSWKSELGLSDREDLLDWIILSKSPDSYLRDERNFSRLDREMSHTVFSSVYRSLGIEFNKVYGVDMNDIELLKGVYLVTINGCRQISDLADLHRSLLDRLHVTLEVD